MYHGENWGENFVMIMMLLLVSIIIYYNMNPSIHPSICEDFSVIRSLKLYAILLPT